MELTIVSSDSGFFSSLFMLKLALLSILFSCTNYTKYQEYLKEYTHTHTHTQYTYTNIQHCGVCFQHLGRAKQSRPCVRTEDQWVNYYVQFYDY